MDYAKEYDRLVEQSNRQQEEIETMRHKLAAANAEIERLKSENDVLRIEVEQWKATSRENKLIAEQMAEPYKRELAAIQAREQQLLAFVWKAKEGLVQWYVHENRYAALDAINEALALPQDTTTLQAMIANAGEVMRERMIAAGFSNPHEEYFGGTIQLTIRAIPGVTLEDLKA